MMEFMEWSAAQIGMGAVLGLASLGAAKYHRELGLISLTLKSAITNIFAKKPSDADLATLFAPDFQSNPNAPSLVLHMETFADEHGNISEKSIYAACIKKYRLPHDVATSYAVGTLQIAWYRNVPGVKLTLKGDVVGSFKAEDAKDKITHPWDTGFYNRMTGLFDDARFNELKQYAVRDAENNPGFTPSCVQKYLDEWRLKDRRWEDAVWLFKLLGKVGNTNEFKFLYEKASRCTVYNSELKKDEPFISLTDFESFYRNSAFLVKEIQNGLVLEPTRTVRADDVRYSQSGSVAFYQPANDTTAGATAAPSELNPQSAM